MVVFIGRANRNHGSPKGIVADRLAYLGSWRRRFVKFVILHNANQGPVTPFHSCPIRSPSDSHKLDLPNDEQTRQVRQ